MPIEFNWWEDMNPLHQQELRARQAMMDQEAARRDMADAFKVPPGFFEQQNQQQAAGPDFRPRGLTEQLVIDNLKLILKNKTPGHDLDAVLGMLWHDYGVKWAKYENAETGTVWYGPMPRPLNESEVPEPKEVDFDTMKRADVVHEPEQKRITDG